MEAVRREARQANVDRTALDVQAMLGHPARASMQFCVGFRRAVAADHLVRLVAVGKGAQIGEDIEHRGVHRVNVAGAKIPQQPVDPTEL